MNLPQRGTLWSIFLHNIRVGFGAILLLSTFAWAPATYPGYWQALEGFIPTFNVTRMNAVANVGVVPDLWRGIGHASFWLSQPFLLLGFAPTTTIRIGFILCCLLGSLGCYSWLQGRLGDRAAGLAGVLYLFAPPLLATIYIRGSLSDATIIALLPVALAGLAAYTQRRALSAAAVTVLAILWMWQAQAGLALCCTLSLLLYAWLVERNWLSVLIVGVSGLAGLTTLVAFWEIRAESPVYFFDHFVYLYQLFRAEWQQAPSIAGWQDRFPFQLSIVAVLYSVFYGFFAWRPRFFRRTTERSMPMVHRQMADSPIDRLWLFGCGITILAIFLTLPWSTAFWQISHAHRLLTYPWQLLLLTVPFLAAAGGALPATHPLFRQTPLWVVLLLMVVFNSSPYIKASYTSIQAPTTPIAFIGEHDNLVILSATVTENRQPSSAELTLIWQVLQPLSFDYNIFFQALQREPASGDNDSLSVIAQLDSQPISAGPAPTTWQPGQIFTSTYQLDLSQPDDVRDRTDGGDGSSFTYYFGYYNWRDGIRLPVDRGIDDKLILYGEYVSPASVK